MVSARVTSPVRWRTFGESAYNGAGQAMRRRLSRAEKRLRQRRKARGLSPEELGRRAGISRDAVGRLERGEQKATLTVLMKLAAALAANLASLL